MKDFRDYGAHKWTGGPGLVSVLRRVQIVHVSPSLEKIWNPAAFP